jgi:hypothetical protein
MSFEARQKICNIWVMLILYYVKLISYRLHVLIFSYIRLSHGSILPSIKYQSTGVCKIWFSYRNMPSSVQKFLGISYSAGFFHIIIAMYAAFLSAQYIGTVFTLLSNMLLH